MNKKSSLQLQKSSDVQIPESLVSKNTKGKVPWIIMIISILLFIFNPVYGHHYWYFISREFYYIGRVIFTALVPICLILSSQYYLKTRGCKGILLLGFSIGILWIYSFYWHYYFTQEWFEG